MTSLAAAALQQKDGKIAANRNRRTGLSTAEEKKGVSGGGSLFNDLASGFSLLESKDSTTAQQSSVTTASAGTVPSSSNGGSQSGQSHLRKLFMLNKGGVRSGEPVSLTV